MIGIDKQVLFQDAIGSSFAASFFTNDIETWYYVSLFQYLFSSLDSTDSIRASEAHVCNEGREDILMHWTSTELSGLELCTRVSI